MEKTYCGLIELVVSISKLSTTSQFTCYQLFREYLIKHINQSVRLSVVSYALPHLWVDLDKILHGDLLMDTGGSDVEPSQSAPGGGLGLQLQKGCSRSCNRGITLFSMSSS